MTVKAEIDGSMIAVQSEYRDKELIKQLPGARWDKDNGLWRVPLSWASCKALRGVFGDELEICPTLWAWAAECFRIHVEPMMQLRAADDWPGDEDLRHYQRVGVAFLTGDIERQNITDMGIVWSYDLGGKTLGDDMGTGKTVMGARAMRKVYQVLGSDAVFPALIACPNTVKGQAGREKGWYGELEKWFPEARVGVVRGNATQRRKVLAQLAAGELDVAIINWENLRNHSRLAAYGSVRIGTCNVCDPSNPKKQTSCERCPRELNEIAFRTVIADEAHRAKDPKSKQTRALKAIMHQPTVLWRWALSGTLTGDAMDEAWSPMNAIAPNEYPSRTKYIDRYALQSWNAFGGMDVVGLRSDTRDEFYAFFDPRFLRRPREYALRDLKDPQYNERLVELTPKQKRLYKELADEMIARLDDGDLMFAMNPLQQTARLNQAAASYLERTDCEKCSGTGKRPEWHIASPHPDPAYAEAYCWCAARLDDVNAHDERCRQCVGAGFYFTLTAPSNKVDELVTLVTEEMPDEQIVVFAVSRQLIELAAVALEKANVPAMQITGEVPENVRYANVEGFRNGDYRVALVVIDAGGEGLDGLQIAKTGVFLQRHYSLTKNKQAEGRLLRSGQEGQVVFIDVRSEGTIEQDKEFILAAKQDRAQEVLRDADTMRRLLAIRP